MSLFRRWPAVLLVLLWLWPGSPAHVSAAQGERASREDPVGLVAYRRDGRPPGLAQPDGEVDQPYLPPADPLTLASVVASAHLFAPQPVWRVRARSFVVGIPRGPPLSV